LAAPSDASRCVGKIDVLEEFDVTRFDVDTNRRSVELAINAVNAEDPLVIMKILVLRRYDHLDVKSEAYAVVIQVPEPGTQNSCIFVISNRKFSQIDNNL